MLVEREFVTSGW